MNTIEEILKLKRTNQPFCIVVSDGGTFEIPNGESVSTHPNGTGTSVTVYGGEDEEYVIAASAIRSIEVGSEVPC